MDFGLGKLALLAIKSKEIPGSIFATKKKIWIIEVARGFSQDYHSQFGSSPPWILFIVLSISALYSKY